MLWADSAAGLRPALLPLLSHRRRRHDRRHHRRQSVIVVTTVVIVVIMILLIIRVSVSLPSPQLQPPFRRYGLRCRGPHRLCHHHCSRHHVGGSQSCQPALKFRFDAALLAALLSEFFCCRAVGCFVVRICIGWILPPAGLWKE